MAETKKKTSAGKSTAKKTAAGTTTARKKTQTKASASKRSSSRKTIPVPEPKTPVFNFPIAKEILVILAVGFTVLLCLCCYRKPGESLAWLQEAVFYLFGQASYVIPVFCFFTLCFIIANYGRRGLWIRLMAIFFFLVAACGIASLAVSTGGILGDSLVGLLKPALGEIGAYVVMVILIIVGLVIFTKRSLIRLLKQHSRRAYEAVRAGQEYRRGEQLIRNEERELEKEREKSRRLFEQQRRMEELKEAKEREIARRREFVPVRGIGDVTLEPDEEDLALLAFKHEPADEDDAAADKTSAKSSKGSKASKGSAKRGQTKPAGDFEEVSPEFLGEIHFGERYREENDILTGQRDSRTNTELELLDRNSGSETDTVQNNDFNKFDFYDDSYREEAEAVSDDIPDEMIKEEVPVTSKELPWEQDGPYDAGNEWEEFDDSIPVVTESKTAESPYQQELPPDSAEGFLLPAKNTYSNLSSRETTEENRTKTVRTATGKVITVELDGLPGEKKQPAEAPKRQLKEEEMMGIVPEPYIEPKEYVFPSISLLRRGSANGTSKEEMSRRLKETAVKLQQTLQNFGVGVTVTNISCGPSVTRYELQPEQGVKVSRIVSLADDIKLNLAAEDIRIEAPIPGKAAIGIEVPNKEKQSVMLRDLLESEDFKKHDSKIVFAAGMDIAGSTILADIAKMPHLLIAGATGSGKSVCINTIIMSILYKARPSEVKLIMIDPKVVELSIYNGIPHLMIPVVTDPKKAAGALNWAVTEMTDRYQKFAEYHVRDMKSYNEKVDSVTKDGIPEKDCPKKMPQIVIIVDELADLMMVAPGDVEEAICRLAQMARAAGIHLVIATQRPSVNVITGLIKANVPSRIAFSVTSGIDSRTIIDMNGAEKLLGKGDMLFYPSGYPKPLRVQGCFVSDDEVSEVVKFLSDQKNVVGGEQNTGIALEISAQDSTGGQHAKDDVDEYFERAGRVIIEKDKASIGMLQRIFKIGFNRAARIMDQLAQAGVVSEEEGTKPRRVLMTMEEFENR